MEKQVINKDEVKHIAELSRLELSEEELTRFKEQFNQILSYFAEIRAMGGSDERWDGESNAVREDEVEDFQDKELIIQNFAERKARFLKAPKAKLK